jgi:hypothetical protein
LRITPTTDWDQWEHLRCGAASIQDQEFIADQKTVPADLIGFVAERPPNTSLESLANQQRLSRRSTPRH